MIGAWLGVNADSTVFEYFMNELLGDAVDQFYTSVLMT